MSPILGIYASQISGHLWSPSPVYDSIATVTVGSGGSSTISFTSIPSTYTHLQLRISALGGSADASIFFNSDTTVANYIGHTLWGNGATAQSDSLTTNPYLDEGATTNTAPQVYVIDFLDYANTSKLKTVRNLWGYDFNANNTTGRVGLRSLLWQNTAAINAISIQNRAYSQYSSFALYGVK